MEGKSSTISMSKEQPCKRNQEQAKLIQKESELESKIETKKIAPNVSLDLDLSEEAFNVARLKLNLNHSKSGSSQPSSSSLAKFIIKRDDDKVYPCKYCNHKFYSCQALGGHQNGHKRERINEKRKIDESNARALSKSLRTNLNLSSRLARLPFNGYSDAQSFRNWSSVNSRIQNPQGPIQATIPRWGSSWLENNRSGMAHQNENGANSRIQNPQGPLQATIPRWGPSWLENNRSGMAHQNENGANSRIQNPQGPLQATIPRWGSSWLENNRSGMAHQNENGATSRTLGSSSSSWATDISNTTGAAGGDAGDAEDADLEDLTLKF